LGDDVYSTEGGDDFLYGGLGSDRLYSGEGSDLIVGGPGDDKLYSQGDMDRTDVDTYVFYEGDGHDIVYSSRSWEVNVRDVLKFESVDDESIRLEDGGDNLRVHYGAQGDYVDLFYYVKYNRYRYLEIEWSDGSREPLTSVVDRLGY